MKVGYSELPGFPSATAAFNNAETEGFANKIVDSPGGRYTGTVKTQRTFATAETLIFAVPDYALGDNAGGISVVISPAGDSIAGDYNGNGVVDAADYVLWRHGGPLQNEVATLGTATAEDYTEWRKRFGNHAGSGAAEMLVPGGASAPEPTLWLIVAVGMAVRATNRTKSRQGI